MLRNPQCVYSLVRKVRIYNMLAPVLQDLGNSNCCLFYESGGQRARCSSDSDYNITSRAEMIDIYGRQMLQPL